MTDPTYNSSTNKVWLYVPTVNENAFKMIDDGGAGYAAGWNAALTACGISGGGTVYTGTVSTAWDSPRQSANRISVLKPYYAHDVSAK